MAIFRKVHVTFWKDSFIETLTPEQRYFYLYLITNGNTTQCGIYEISIRQMSFDTGYNEETVLKLIKMFVSLNKIRYENKTQEIAIKNWSRYNDSTSPKVKACINKELVKVKDKSLIAYLGLSLPEGDEANPNYRVTGAKRNEVFEMCGNKCTKCFSTENLAIDHIIPRTMGGSSIIDNLRVLCRSCNSKRPLGGIELINEIRDSGYNYEDILKLSKKVPYEYSIGRGTQEEQEQEQEQDVVSEFSTTDFENNKRKALTELFRRITNWDINVVYIEVGKFMNKYPHIEPNKSGALINTWAANYQNSPIVIPINRPKQMIL